MDEVDNRLGCFCLQWSSADEIDYSPRPEMADKEVEVWKWFGIELFSSLGGNMNEVQINHSVSPFSLPVHLAKQWFFINRIYGTVGEAIADV